MRATEQLRQMLDERGVEWVDTGDGSTLIPEQAATNVAWDVNVWPSGKDMGDCLWVQNRHPLTPEQAIAATLGGGECSIEKRNGDWCCTGCGEMVGTCDTASELHIDGNAVELWNHCPRCGKAVKR